LERIVVILLWILFLPVGIVLAILLMFVLLPIRTGASGYYTEAGAAVHGWVRAFAGLLGVVIDYDGAVKRFCVVFGPWVIWRPKGDKEADKKEAPVESNRPAFSPFQETPKETTPDLSSVIEQRDDESIPIQPPPHVLNVETQRTSAEPESRVGQTDVAPSVVSRPEQVEADSQKKPDLEPREKKPSLWDKWRKLKVQITRYRGYWNDVQPIVWRFVKRLFHIIRFRRLEIEVVLGTGDPASTGKLFGYAQAVRPLLGKHLRFDMRPDFTRERAEVTGTLELSVYVYRILWAVGCLLIRGGWAGWRIWRIEKKAQQVMTPSEV
jgi:hypothetical protein